MAGSNTIFRPVYILEPTEMDLAARVEYDMDEQGKIIILNSFYVCTIGLYITVIAPIRRLLATRNK